MAPGPDQGLLDDVLGGAAVTGEPRGVREEGSAVFLVERSDERLVTRALPTLPSAGPQSRHPLTPSSPEPLPSAGVGIAPMSVALYTDATRRPVHVTRVMRMDQQSALPRAFRRAITGGQPRGQCYSSRSTAARARARRCLSLLVAPRRIRPSGDRRSARSRRRDPRFAISSAVRPGRFHPPARGVSSPPRHRRRRAPLRHVRERTPVCRTLPNALPLTVPLPPWEGLPAPPPPLARPPPPPFLCPASWTS
jgi:hypothetical protein